MINYEPETGQGIAASFKAAHDIARERKDRVIMLGELCTQCPAALLEISPDLSPPDIARRIILAFALFIDTEDSPALRPSADGACPSLSIAEQDCHEVWGSLSRHEFSDNSPPLLSAALKLITRKM